MQQGFAFATVNNPSTIIHNLTVKNHDTKRMITRINGGDQNYPKRTKNFGSFLQAMMQHFPRGGRTVLAVCENSKSENEDNEHENAKQADIRQHPDYDKLQAYRMKQQVLLQLRATALSEALAARGVGSIIPSIKDVSTLEGKIIPNKVDWDCAVSTMGDPKHCLICYEPEIGSKLIVPMCLDKSDKWITLSELNRLRRNDPSKVEPMWNSQYAILTSWFSPRSRYSLLHYVGWKGIVLNSLLVSSTLQVVVVAFFVVGAIMFMPVIQRVVGRFLVSPFLWLRWPSWSRFVHVGLPFKLLVFQVVYNQASLIFKQTFEYIKEKLIDFECQVLEETIPLTLGVGTPANSKVTQNGEEAKVLVETLDIIEEDG